MSVNKKGSNNFALSRTGEIIPHRLLPCGHLPKGSHCAFAIKAKSFPAKALGGGSPHLSVAGFRSSPRQSSSAWSPGLPDFHQHHRHWRVPVDGNPERLLPHAWDGVGLGSRGID
jgi:hypothetical protein